MLRERSARAVAGIRSVIGADELLLSAALVLLALGMREIWAPGVYLAPAVVLLWIALPTRKTFIDRIAAPDAADRRRR